MKKKTAASRQTKPTRVLQLHLYMQGCSDRAKYKMRNRMQITIIDAIRELYARHYGVVVLNKMISQNMIM